MIVNFTQSYHEGIRFVSVAPCRPKTTLSSERVSKWRVSKSSTNFAGKRNRFISILYLSTHCETVGRLVNICRWMGWDCPPHDPVRFSKRGYNNYETSPRSQHLYVTACFGQTNTNDCQQVWIDVKSLLKVVTFGRSFPRVTRYKSRDNA